MRDHSDIVYTKKIWLNYFVSAGHVVIRYLSSVISPEHGSYVAETKDRENVDN